MIDSAQSIRIGRLLSWLRYLGASLRWPGLLGLALAIAALGMDWFVNGQLVAENDSLQTKVRHLRKDLARAATAAIPVATRATENLLAGDDELALLVSAIHAGALQHQVFLDQGSYDWQDQTAAHSARYRMSFPARGTYPQLRIWASELLEQHPQLTLEQFDFKRDNIASEIVNARTRFVVQLRGSR